MCSSTGATGCGFLKIKKNPRVKRNFLEMFMKFSELPTWVSQGRQASYCKVIKALAHFSNSSWRQPVYKLKVFPSPPPPPPRVLSSHKTMSFMPSEMTQWTWSYKLKTDNWFHKLFSDLHIHTHTHTHTHTEREREREGEGEGERQKCNSNNKNNDLDTSLYPSKHEVRVAR
jgi:hypothetical protein